MSDFARENPGKEMSNIGRREFLAAAGGAAVAVSAPAYLYPGAAHAADAAKAAKKPVATGGAEPAGESGMNDYQFRLGMYLPELGLPFDEALATAKQIGAEGVWFNGIPNEPEIANAGDVDYRTILRQVRDHRLDAVLSVSTHFRPPSGSRVEAMHINYANLK